MALGQHFVLATRNVLTVIDYRHSLQFFNSDVFAEVI